MPSVPSNIDRLTALVSRLKNVDYSAVTRDRAVTYIAQQCTGLTPVQVQVVIKNVLG